METYILSKLDLAALKQGDYLHVSLVNGEGKVRVAQRREKTEKDPFAEDVQHYISAPVTVQTATYGEVSRARCSALMYFWRGQDSHLSAVVAALKVGDELTFQFYPDAHTTQNMEQHGLHGDILRLIVKRGKHRYCFDIDHSNCPDNSARMCQGASYRLVA